MGETRGSSLCRSILCSLGSTSTPSISRSIPTTSWSLLRLLLRCSPHLPTPPDDHQPPAPLLLLATRASVTFSCIIAFLCLLSSLPGFLIQSALYVVLATSLLRMPLPTVLAGHLLYSAISFLHPIRALFLLLPCLHKLHVRGQPLGDPVSWGVRFTGSNAAWNQNVNHNHQY